MITSTERLLLWLVRTRLNPAPAETVPGVPGETETVPPSIDWGRLLDLAEAHGLLPVVYKGLEHVDPEGIPPPLLEDSRRRFRENARRNLGSTAVLLRVLHLLEARGIRALSFKGPLLAASVYGDVALREFVDLDLLVRAQEFEKARAVLQSEGYQATLPHPNGRGAARFRLDDEHVLRRADDGVSVDLHWRLLPDPFFLPFDYESLWKQAQPFPLGDSRVWTLCPEDLLSVLCVNGTKGLWEKLEWVLAIAVLVSPPNRIDWEQVVRQAPIRGGERIHWLCLALAHDLLGAALPTHILRRIRADPAVPGLVRRLENALFEKEDREAVLSQLWVFFRMSGSFGEKARFLFRLGAAWVRPTEKDWRLLPLPDGLFPLYYLLRPLRLAAKYGSRLGRLLFKSLSSRGEGS